MKWYLQTAASVDSMIELLRATAGFNQPQFLISYNIDLLLILSNPVVTQIWKTMF